MTENGRFAIWPHACGEMAARIRLFPWVETALGPPATWPSSVRAAVELMLDMPCVASVAIGPDLLLLYNDAAARLQGRAHPAALAAPLFKAHPGEWGTTGTYYARALAGEGVHVPAYAIEGGSAGAGEMFESFLSPVRDEHGAVVAVHMIGFAIGERLDAERALRESEERLRQFGEASKDVLWIRDAETLQWEYLTPAFETIYGVDRDVALSGDNMASWLQLIVPGDRAFAERALHRVRGGEQVTFEYRIRRPSDGEIRWLRNTDFPIRDESGAVTRIGGIGQDITDVKAADEALSNSEQRQRALLEGMPQLVWRAVDGGEWTWASPQWTEYTGQAGTDSRGWGWLVPLHPDDRDGAREAWSVASKQGSLDAEYRILHADTGAYRWFHTRASPVRNRAGDIIEWLGTSTDIHDMRELQERQRVLVAELQHRTRNLIGVVRSMADKTAKASVDLPDFRARFRTRLDALARVQGLLSRLHDHDRVTFDDLIGAEMAALDGAADHISLSGPTGVRLRSSMVQTLAMALHELATNALKYGALSQPQGHLEIAWEVDAAIQTDRPWLSIDWRERGVVMQARAGMRDGGGHGRELIECALPYQLGARTTFDIGEDGVHCTIAVPVSAHPSDVSLHG